jgi:uncharacterized protein
MSTSTVQVRNLRFELDDGVPRHWHGGRRSLSSFFDNLSVFFPAGERFFIASVRAHERHVTDPALRDDIRAFCAQEGMHGREHVRYNAMLARQGYPVAAMDRRVRSLLALVTRVTPARWQLAATCALEHFTALMAHLLLADPRLLDGAHPAMAALWRWHAVEENEHRHVAYDVWEAAGGTYAERVLVMAAATVIFWAKVVEQQARMMHVDGTLFSPREWASLVRFLVVEPGGMRPLAGLYLAYYRPGFHPLDIDCSHLLDAWRREYASQQGLGGARALWLPCGGVAPRGAAGRRGQSPRRTTWGKAPTGVQGQSPRRGAGAAPRRGAGAEPPPGTPPNPSAVIFAISSRSTASALSFSTWQVPAAWCPPPP